LKYIKLQHVQGLPDLLWYRRSMGLS